MLVVDNINILYSREATSGAGNTVNIELNKIHVWLYANTLSLLKASYTFFKKT